MHELPPFQDLRKDMRYMSAAGAHIHLVLGTVPSLSPGQRPGKRRQRQVAARCIAGLGQLPHRPDQPTISVSHSRTRVVAAGTVCGASGPVGVDLEYADTARNWHGIIGLLSRGSCDVSDRLHGALVWTACEAVFKAAGWVPAPTEIRDIGLRCRPVVDNHDLVAVQRCGPVLLLSMLLPQDRSFALTVAVPGGSAADRPEDVTLEFHTVGSEGDDARPTVSMRIPVRTRGRPADVGSVQRDGIRQADRLGPGIAVITQPGIGEVIEDHS